MYMLKSLREDKGLSMKELARVLNIPYTTYVGYEKGQREPSSDFLIKIADYYDTTTDYLLGATTNKSKPSPFAIENIIPLPQTKKIPLLGNIACGEPILAEENIDDYIKLDKDIPADFALRCKGDSMINARIFDGDIVYIRQQPDVENGEIAAVLINNEATLKRVYKYPHRIELRAENPTIKPFEYSDEEMNNIHILGKAVAFTSVIR